MRSEYFSIIPPFWLSAGQMSSIFAPMQCPYCHAPLTETSTECPSCQISLHSANALLGPMPRFAKGLTDELRVIEKGSDKKSVTRLRPSPNDFLESTCMGSSKNSIGDTPLAPIFSGSSIKANSAQATAKAVKTTPSY